MSAFDGWQVSPGDAIPRAVGRPAKPEAERVTPRAARKKYRNRKNAERMRNIAVFDTETDPFNKARPDDKIFPFTGCLYSDQFDPIEIWDENPAGFVDKIISAIEGLPGAFTIYAHNGGKFDFLFLVSRLRGRVSFKGRGIMSARIGRHELRDSFHIVPERLAAIQKEKFDYSWMHKSKRNLKRKEILAYQLSDCKYLFGIVQDFVARFGLKLTIGQAAMAELKKNYAVKNFSPNWDEYIRQYYFGGRVECLKGRGHFKGDYKLYDVNSMYPYAMAQYQHPTGDMFDYKIRIGTPSNDTVFIDVTCDNNGALVRRNDNMETTARERNARFFTTIWEYEVALKHGLISNVHVNYSVDCKLRTDFALFVNPLYEKRLVTKASMQQLKARGLEGTGAFIDLKRDDIFYKLLLNNAYGKFAQNPANFKDHYLTDPDEMPEDKWFQSMVHDALKKPFKLPTGATWFDELSKLDWTKCTPRFEGAEYHIWEKPNPGFRYRNVGTAASITGAARAILLDALMGARDAIYCDTDSIICRELTGVPLHKSALGAWDLEDEFSEVVIDGKKLYSVKHIKPKHRSPEDIERGLVPEYTIKSKGINGLVWSDMVAMLEGAEIPTMNFAPTLTRYGEQSYIPRRVRATAPLLEI